MKTINIGLLGVYPTDMNKGCEALLYSEIAFLHSLNNEHRKLNIVILSGSRKKYSVTYRIGSFEEKVEVWPINLTSSLGDLLNALKNFKTYKDYATLDYVLCIGLGDSFADIYGMDRFYSINRPIELMQSKKVKTIFMPQTIGPFKSDEARIAAAKTLDKAVLVLPRDKKSFDCVKKISHQENVTELVDMAFYLPFTRLKISNGKINVGIAISGLLWRGGYTGKNEFGLKDDYKFMMKSVINSLMSDSQIQIHLTPHVVSGDALQVDDYELAYEIQKEYGNERITLSPFFKNPIMAKDYISDLDFFMGSRMHACIAAFSSGVPVIPISYSRKFSGLFEDTLGYKHIADPTTQTTEEIVAFIHDSIEKREDLKQEIDLILEEKVESCKQNLTNQFNNLLSK